MTLTTKQNVRRACTAGIYALGVTMSSLILYYAYTLFIVRDRQANFVLGLSLALFYLLLVRKSVSDEDAGTEAAEPVADTDSVSRLPASVQTTINSVTNTTTRVRTGARERLSPLLPFWFATLTLVSLVAMVYVELSYTRLTEESLIMGFSLADYLVGGLLILLCIDVTRRAFGNVLGGVILLSIGYALAGPYLPGIFYHTGMNLEQVIRVGILTMSGVFGFILEVGATWVAVFLLLAGFAKAYGILDWVVESSQELGKLTRSGIVHVAIGSSMIMGMITGSGAANTATTGSFTIPMMKKQGVFSSYAGAIEATASIGGQLVPPIMGVAAFVMADLIGVPYVDIVRAGVIPAFLFYFSIVVAVQILLYKHGWTTVKSRDIDWSVFSDAVFYVVPFGVLLYFLVVLRYTPLTSGLYTAVAIVGIFFAKSAYERRLDGVADASKRTVVGLKQGAVDMAPLIAILGSIGVAIAMFVRTGFAQKLATLMVGLSGQNLVLLLVLAMVVSLLFGMGMPAPAAYILTASLAATAMIQLGIQDLTAHMFVFYFAMYSSLTPPVGPSTVVGARIAEANFIETGKRAMQLALPGFLVPYVFVANDSIIYWEWPATALVFVAATVSVVGITVATFGFDGRNAVNLPGRVTLFGLSLVGLFGSRLPADFGFGPHALQLVATGAVVGGLLYSRRSGNVEPVTTQASVREN